MQKKQNIELRKCDQLLGGTVPETPCPLLLDPTEGSSLRLPGAQV